MIETFLENSVPAGAPLAGGLAEKGPDSSPLLRTSGRLLARQTSPRPVRREGVPPVACPHRPANGPGTAGALR